ncbi:hypothetical protein ANN_18595 [Periplaneta americana]|uniref:Uncharacterized protein n=1 Tax=Periplaneta americana TaxID=6978 RepID=A0ABQ8SP72_PERAM|nr:hypothetical protein ANN_18595 [Periplaneta americana]
MRYQADSPELTAFIKDKLTYNINSLQTRYNGIRSVANSALLRLSVRNVNAIDTTSGTTRPNVCYLDPHRSSRQLFMFICLQTDMAVQVSFDEPYRTEGKILSRIENLLRRKKTRH